MEQSQFIEEVLQAVNHCKPFKAAPAFPSLHNSDDIREFDQALVSAIEQLSLPSDWSLIGKKDSRIVDTLLHFAARHGLNSLCQYLLSLPGSSEAAISPDSRGQLPIDIAHSQGNEGLAQLLTLFVDDLESKENGATISPHRERAFALPAQDLDKFKEINQQWTSQVKRFRSVSHNSVMEFPTTLTNGPVPAYPPSRHIPVMKKRRSSIAVMDIGKSLFVPATPIEALQVNTRDPLLAIMERSRKNSWSRIVGSSDCRSVGTGLNELDRISAEESIQERLVKVKTELVELDQQKQETHTRNHLKLSQSHLNVMYRLSTSCPSLNEDDESDVASAFLSAATSPGGRTASPASPPISPEQTLPIPHVVTTEYNESKLETPTELRSVTTIEGVRVEESIIEHRTLNQNQTSPVSSDPNTRSDDDYVLVSSNVSREPSPELELSSTLSDNLTPVGTPVDTKDMPSRIPTPLRSNVRFKTHRRSLSSSEIELMSSVSSANGEIGSGGWNSPITSIEEGPLSAQDSTTELDERSRASSLLTNETASNNETESDDEKSSTSIDQFSSGPFEVLKPHSPANNNSNEASDSIAEGSVMLRDFHKRERLRASMSNRYSADFVISSGASYDDVQAGDTTPETSPREELLAVTDVSPSDIDISLKSGDNSSLENSQSAFFFKTTGSPKTIKKGKSPLLSRRSTIAYTKNEGLPKEKVGATINALKDLIQRQSDNDELEQSNADYLEDEGRPRSNSGLRTPIHTPPPGSIDDCSSLDFVPGSPLLRDQHKLNSPSPLTKRAHERVANSLSPAPEAEEEVTKSVTEPPSKEVRFVDQDTCLLEDDLPKEKKKFIKFFGGGQKSLKKKDGGETAESAKVHKQRSLRKHRYEDVVLKYVTPKEYESESTKAPSINRSASLQVGMDNVGSEPAHLHHKRSTSVQDDHPPRLATLVKQASEQNITSPIRFSDGVLSPLEEVPSDSNSPSPNLLPTSPHVGAHSGDSENEQEELPRTFSETHPVLKIQEEYSWDKTVDRRLYKKLNKAERERQAILHELLQTEKNHFRALHVLKLIFRQHMTKISSEETIAQLFPELDNLIEISDVFLKKLESKKRDSEDVMIDDLSDVLLEQFVGPSRDQMLKSFGNFCSEHLNATEIYKEHLKKRSFSRLMKQLHTLKECQRLTLPDYYLQVSQRLSKLLTLLRRLAKKSESLKLDHAHRVRESLKNLEELVAAVDLSVEDHKMRMEVEAIQSRLDLPKSSKFKDRRERLNFSLTAQDRRLRKRGLAEWIGHGKEASVHVILVTDMVVLLTERDQRYHMASLLDHKPPVIRLYDLHVRVNVSVKSGVQLLLLEKGNSPEMFRLEFSSKKLAREWETALNSAIETCKDKKLKCEYFGADQTVLGEEEKVEESSDMEETNSLDLSNPALRSMQRARESVVFAIKLLTPRSVTSADLVRSHAVATTSSNSYSKPNPQDLPKTRNRSQTTRPKTAFFVEDDPNTGGTSATMPGDHVITAPVHTGKPPKPKTEKKRGKLDRSSTFRSKDKEKERSANTENDITYRVPEQQYIKCITNLKDCLQDFMNICDDKDLEINKLKNELAVLRESQSPALSASPSVTHRLMARSSPPQARPHSVHIDHIQQDSQNELLESEDKLFSDDNTPNGSMEVLIED